MNLKKVLKKNLKKGTYPPYLLRISDEDLSLIAHAKRFNERYIADPDFRELVKIDPLKAAEKYHIKINPEDIRPIWDLAAREAYYQNKLPGSRLLKLCIEHDAALIGWSTRHKDGKTIKNSDFKFWREQQILRNNSEIGESANSRVVHAPVCFELSAGCTVGCWFCAISADKFKGAFPYTPENKILWEETLQVVKAITGTAAQGGFCYWATDPFDNPDYEKFIKDYRSIIGGLPATNTAMSHKNLPRTKSLVQMWKNHGFTCNHLSILTVNILNTIHNEFTAEELVWTNLNLVNKQSTVKKSTAGRAREKIIKLAKNSNEYREITTEFAQGGTIACVSGFLFNMVDKKVKLISPCKASDRWPNGYIIFDEGTFTNGEDLKELLDDLIKKNMPLSIPNDRVIKFRPDLQYKPLAYGFKLSSEFQSQKIENPHYGKKFGELINEGTHTVDGLIKLIIKADVSRDDIKNSIDILFKNGLLLLAD